MDVTSMPHPLRRLLGQPKLGVIVAGAGLGLLLAWAVVPRVLDAERTSVPFFLPVYEIEAHSNGHDASILNLPLPYVGAPQVPIPVDINGDLIPDVTASVNLVNPQGVFNNPPDLDELVAPNIEFTRLFAAPILTPGADPLRINVKFTVGDLTGAQDDIVVRYGYETGPGGSIPPKYKAVVSGVGDFFDPLVARIDTTGGYLIGLDPRLDDLGLSPAAQAYEGPLSTFATLDTGPELNADVDLRFKAQPELIEVSYGGWQSGDEQHLTFAHQARREVDLVARAALVAGDLEVDATLQIDRLPRQVAVDIIGDGADGGIEYTSEPERGRNADLALDLDARGIFDTPLIARIDMESLPREMSAAWRSAPGETPSVAFSASEQGIGAIDARIQNYDGDPTSLVPWVPDHRQFASVQVDGASILGDETLIQARVERIRSVVFGADPDGAITGQIEVGDGHKPLQVHAEIDLRASDDPALEGLPFVDLTGLIAPLPDSIGFTITPTGEDTTQPMHLEVTPSETIDVDLTARIGFPGTTGPVVCGDAGALCGDLELRNVPQAITASIINTEFDKAIDIAAEPRAGAAPLDIFGSVILGPVDIDGLPPVAGSFLNQTLHADFAVQSVARFLHVAIEQAEDEALRELDVRTCQVDADTGECVPGTDGPTDEIGEATFAVRNFAEADRPSGLPRPPSSGPFYLTAVVRGLPETNETVDFEVTGRITDIRELRFYNEGPLTAGRFDVGGGKDFRTYIDIEDLDLDGGDPDTGRISLAADVRVLEFPSPAEFCLAQHGHAAGAEPTHELTARCESDDPFGDGTSVVGPMVVDFRAPGPLSILADLELTGDLPFELPGDLPLDFGTFDRVAASLALTDLPSEFTGVIGAPNQVEGADEGDASSSVLRVLTRAPGATDTVLDLAAEMTTPGADCRLPDQIGGAICADLLVEELPEHASVLYATETADDGTTLTDLVAEFHACNQDFFGTGACVPGTEGEIGVIDLEVRAHAGDPTGILPTYVAPDGPHLFALGRLIDLATFDLRAGLRIEDLRKVAFRQDEQGVTLSSDVGSGVDPLVVHAYGDLREATDLIPELALVELIADLTLDPLPQQLDVVLDRTQRADGETLEVRAEVSEAALLSAAAEVRQAGVPDGADCGVTGTYCVEIVVDDLPQLFEAELDRTFGPVVDRRQEEVTRVSVNQERFAPDASKADITVRAAVGLPITLPLLGDGPLYADVTLTGVPDRLAVGLDAVAKLDSGETGTEGLAVERVQVHTCDRDFDDEVCVPGTEDQLDGIEASIRTFDLRPTDFPTPTVEGAPLRVEVAGRGLDLETYVALTEVSEFQYLSRDGLTGATARLGGGTALDPRDFHVNIDVEDLPMRDVVDLGELGVDDPIADIRATVEVTPFPGELAFCMREAGITPVPPSSNLPFTAACESTTPFGVPLTTHTPLSIGFDANQDFDLHVAAELGVRGTNSATGDPIEPHRAQGRLDIDDLPKELTFHLLTPREVEVPTVNGPETITVGPFRGRIVTPQATSGLDLSFAAAGLVGADTICEDPRPNRQVVCASGEIVDLPTTVDFFYDPSLDLSDPSLDLLDPADTTNFVLQTDGPSDTQINDLRVFASIFGFAADAIPDTPFDLGQVSTDVLLLTVDMSDLKQPFDLRGTLDLDGDEPTIDLRVGNGDTLPAITIDAQNFIGADPTADAFVPDRPVAENPGLPEHPIEVIQRGKFARVHADLVTLAGITVKPVRSDVDRKPIGTTAIGADFGSSDFNLRAFLDLAPVPGTRLLADVLVGDIPAAIEGCFRSERHPDRATQDPVPGTETWCDDRAALDGKEGALQVEMVPINPALQLDVDAFARFQADGGSTVLAGRVQVDNVPNIVRARFGGEDVEVSGHRKVIGDLVVPDGIDRIAFEAASFDLAPAATGIVGPLPYDQVVNLNDPFPVAPAPADGREFVHAAADLSGGLDLDSLAFHVHGQIGRSDGAPSSQLQRFLYSTQPCTAPVSGAPDYPRLPTDDGTQHTCIKVDFDDLDPDPNPLSLDAAVLLPKGVTLHLHDAGISDIPQWLQVNIADAETFTDPENERGWRRPCPPAAQTGDTDGCMAPLLRFDQPDESFLFGVLDVTTGPGAPVLGAIGAKGIAPGFDRIPDEHGWDANPFNGGQNPDQGITVKAAIFDGGDLTGGDVSRLAARAAFRLPIPQSLTIDQIQTYDDDLQTKVDGVTPVAGSKADDLRFRAVVKDSAGNVVDNLGQLAALFHKVGSGAQVLLTQPCPTDVAEANATAPRPDCAEFERGVQLPGETALTVYLREHLADAPDDKLRTSTFVHVDGRISTTMDIGARLFGNGATVTDGISLGDVEVSLRNLPAYSGGGHPHEPSFRLRAELITDGDKPEAPSGTAVSVSGEQGPELNEWYEFNFDMDIGIERAVIGFDFSPTANPARRLDATIHVGAGKVPRIGADLAGYANLAGTQPAPVSMGASVLVTPLDMKLRTNSNVGANLQILFNDWLAESLGAPGWLVDVIDFLLTPVFKLLDVFINSFPLELDLASDLSFQFSVDRLQTFTLRNNLMHAQMDGSGPGSATLGPINWYIDELNGGAYFKLPSIKVPKYICWVPGIPCTINFPRIGLATYDYVDLTPPGIPSPPILLDFRSCNTFGLIPFSGSGFNNAATMNPNGGGNLSSGEDFMFWVGTDPRMKLGGILLGGGGIPIFSSPLDGLVDVIVGPIFCKVGAFDFSGIVTNNTGTTDPAAYHPGNLAARSDGAVAFPGHPVPGQPGAPVLLPPELDVPTDPPVQAPDPIDPTPVVDPPPVPPVAETPLYTGDDVVIASAVALCGEHEMSSLVVDAAVTVATSASAATAVTGHPACPAGSEGTLELRANTIVVNPSGSITGDALSTDVPDLGPLTPAYRATGNSGGTNAGVGGIGSAPISAFQNYEGGTEDTNVYPGGPGSEVPVGYSIPDIGDVGSAGAPGNGGAAVVLRADTSLIVNGDISVDGAHGASNLAGECHAEDDEDVPEPPPYLHTGVAGSGGGAGGGIALEARYALQVGGSLSARGGDGGSGLLGAGGAGGGGAVKVLAPFVSGVNLADLQAAVEGGSNGDNSILCEGVPEADDSPVVYDPGGPDIPPDLGAPLSIDGIAVLVNPPYSAFRPYGDFWWPGSFDAHYVSAGGPAIATVCAVRVPQGATYDTGEGVSPLPKVGGPLAALLGTRLPQVETLPDGTEVTHGTLPTAANPCGTLGPNPFSITGAQIVQLGTFPVGATPVIDPSTTPLTIGSSGLYGLYTTTVRGSQVEPLEGIDWAIGVDTQAPTIGLDLAGGPDPLQAEPDKVYTIGAARVAFAAADQPDLSGIRRTECRVLPGSGDWLPCSSGNAVPLNQPDGAKTIQVRAIDRAGNTSAVDSVQVYLDMNPPTASATLVGGVQSNGWYRVAPSASIFGFSAASPPPAPPDPRFVYALNRGAETGCTTDPCTVPSAEIGQLSSGEHVLRYTAINRAGVRHRDDNNPSTPSPMPTVSFRFDPKPPAMALATVPASPSRQHLGEAWFDVRPYVVVSAVDEFGGSGLSVVQYSFDGGSSYHTMDAADPPRAPNGVTAVCFRAFDVAGNVAGPVCETLRVDGQAPASTLAPDFAADGDDGWYVTAPSFTVSGYDDGAGVGADADHFRVRVDNDLAADCDQPSCTIPASRFGTGRHLVHASAADRFENRSGETTIVVGVDLEPPVVVPVVTPRSPDGEHGWYHSNPWLDLHAVDPGDGSGIATLERSLDGGTSWTAHTGPVEVPAGEHTLCWRASDRAGNATPIGCQDLWVDTDDPTATLSDPGAGWFTTPAAVSTTAADTAPGAGLGADPADVCEDLNPAPTASAVSGVCIAVDGGPFVPWTGDVVADEGIHQVQAFSVDRSGRRSEIVSQAVKVDRSPPVVEVRFLPPDPARNGWYRRSPLTILRASDGQDGSGVQSLEYRVDGGSWTPYTEPFRIAEGHHTVEARATDMVGTSTVTRQVKVDSAAPWVRATSPSKSPWLRVNGTLSALQRLLLGKSIVNVGGTNDLRYQLRDELSGDIKVDVVVFDTTGNVVRRLDGGTVTVVPGQTHHGAVAWDGSNHTLTNLVPVGTYYYRVVATDEAGNTAFSGESRITITLL